MSVAALAGFSAGSLGSSAGSTAAASSTASASGTAQASPAIEAHLAFTLSLYDAKGSLRPAFSPQSAPASLTSTLPAKWKEIDVTGKDGTVIDVIQRADGSIVASGIVDGVAATYDSRNGTASVAGTAQQQLADEATTLLGLAAGVGAGSDLAGGAQALLTAALGADGAGAVDVTADGAVAHLTQSAAGVVSALRTTANVALESVTIDGGVVIRSVRNGDGTGSTSVDGLTLGAQADGSASVTFDPARSGAAAAAADVVDALGDRISVSQNGTIALANASGTSFTVTAGSTTATPAKGETTANATSTLDVAVQLGGASGTSTAKLDEQARLQGQRQQIDLTASAVSGAASELALDVAASGSADTTSSLLGSDVATTSQLVQTVAVTGAIDVAIEGSESVAGQSEANHGVFAFGGGTHQILDAATHEQTTTDTNHTGKATNHTDAGFGSFDLSAA